MPGHIGTSIVTNSLKILGNSDTEALSPAALSQARARIAATGLDVSTISDQDIERLVAKRARRFLEEAPMTAAAAATIILDGVKADQWRILVGDDAHIIAERVRQSPEQAYDLDFFESFAAEVGWKLGR